MKLKIIAVILFFAFIIFVPVSSSAQEGDFANYSGWKNLTDREKLCFVLGYGYGAKNLSLSLTLPVNFVKQIDTFYEKKDFQALSVEELFIASNWLSLGFSEEKVNTYLQLRSRCAKKQRITSKEVLRMENLRIEGEKLEEEVIENMK